MNIIASFDVSAELTAPAAYVRAKLTSDAWQVQAFAGMGGGGNHLVSVQHTHASALDLADLLRIRIELG